MDNSFNWEKNLPVFKIKLSSCLNNCTKTSMVMLPVFFLPKHKKKKKNGGGVIEVHFVLWRICDSSNCGDENITK